MSDANHRELMETLRTMLKIQALAAVKNMNSKKDKILFLADGGLNPQEIAPIVGSSAASVRQVSYEARKRAKGEFQQ